MGQWGGAGGASCEDHLAFCGELLGLRGGFARKLARLGKPDFFSPKRRATLRLDAVVDDVIDMIRRIER